MEFLKFFKSMESSVLRKFMFFFVLQLVLSFVLFVSLRSKKNIYQDQNLKTTEPTIEPKEPLIILLWTWPFNNPFPLNHCPYPFDTPGCFYTINQSLYTSADAVVIHHRNACYSKKQLPQIPRPPKQYWIWFNTESPTHSPNLAFMDNVINLTMSYRVDSDIFTPYGWLEEHDTHFNYTIPVKTKLVAWAVSNWRPQYRRSKYYDDLKQYINIDMYGKSRKPLYRGTQIKTISQYKFYLAFENSIHTDYITEKLWYNALTSGTVPVVMGPPRDNYERFIPPDSFIHVDDFPTAQQLAAYLHELDKDDNRYHQYFNWRSRFKPVGDVNWIHHYCKICKSLKEAPPYKTIPSIAKWYK
ncbi:4-galactosyl-N-acetylglucosaminide 3-alpha-L-fucosyltransferase FUT6-like [Discoglossus pictus]